jgi:hypothetical protein
VKREDIDAAVGESVALLAHLCGPGA